MGQVNSGSLGAAGPVSGTVHTNSDPRPLGDVTGSVEKG